MSTRQTVPTYFQSEKQILEVINIKYLKNTRTNRRKYSFSQRVVDHWNSLPDKVVEGSSVNSFKSSINKHWRDYTLKFVPDFYGPEAGISENSLEMDHRG